MRRSLVAAAWCRGAAPAPLWDGSASGGGVERGVEEAGERAGGVRRVEGGIEVAGGDVPLGCPLRPYVGHRSRRRAVAGRQRPAGARRREASAR
ncbi:hypothetical protein [Streptomyces collinus]|nr:hypothetical protein [Streptomyces collinus]